MDRQQNNQNEFLENSVQEPVVNNEEVPSQNIPNVTNPVAPSAPEDTENKSVQIPQYQKAVLPIDKPSHDKRAIIAMIVVVILVIVAAILLIFGIKSLYQENEEDIKNFFQSEETTLPEDAAVEPKQSFWDKLFGPSYDYEDENSASGSVGKSFFISETVDSDRATLTIEEVMVDTSTDENILVIRGTINAGFGVREEASVLLDDFNVKVSRNGEILEKRPLPESFSNNNVIDIIGETVCFSFALENINDYIMLEVKGIYDTCRINVFLASLIE